MNKPYELTDADRALLMEPVVMGDAVKGWIECGYGWATLYLGREQFEFGGVLGGKTALVRAAEHMTTIHAERAQPGEMRVRWELNGPLFSIANGPDLDTTTDWFTGRWATRIEAWLAFLRWQHEQAQSDHVREAAKMVECAECAALLAKVEGQNAEINTLLASNASLLIDHTTYRATIDAQAAELAALRKKQEKLPERMTFDGNGFNCGHGEYYLPAEHLMQAAAWMMRARMEANP